MTLPKPKNIGPAQWSFIKKTRASIDHDAKAFFRQQNWRTIAPKGGCNDSNLLNVNGKKVTVESFYVKALSVWIPHVLIQHHVPTCPHCKSKSHVDVVKARWTNCPIVLFGISSHRYLDTVLYPCQKCRRHFSGTNKKSMELDGAVYYSYFNYYMGHGYAVDDELFRHIILDAPNQATACIARKLKRMAYEAYLDQQQLYFSAVGVGKIRPVKKQKTLLEFLPKAPSDPEVKRLTDERNKQSHEVTKIKTRLVSCRKQLEMDHTFTDMLASKDDRNVYGKDKNKLPGMGGCKLRALIAAGLPTFRTLLAVTDYAQYSRYFTNRFSP